MDLSFVSSLQQLLCFFDGTAFLIRRPWLAMQVSQNRGGRGIFESKILSPGDRWILPSGLFFLRRRRAEILKFRPGLTSRGCDAAARVWETQRGERRRKFAIWLNVALLAVALLVFAREIMRYQPTCVDMIVAQGMEFARLTEPCKSSRGLP